MKQTNGGRWRRQSLALIAPVRFVPRIPTMRSPRFVAVAALDAIERGSCEHGRLKACPVP